MTADDLLCNTWHDVLIEKGFDSSEARSLIGFISWNKGDEFVHLGKEITEILAGHEGKVFAKDAVSSSYGDKALLFFDKDIPEETASKMFEAIMNYEQKEVYSSEEVLQELH
ncbi:hypothetical protein [Clostridium peptidivorans]|uniref:hypothetical protein n=1 Tax=Clostridium peptidivorans TaxID=100174 RepID=UPI000BE228CC|nr:hypothetical protein [Clostridium peptidivorans]